MSDELNMFKTFGKMLGFDVKVEPTEEVKEVVVTEEVTTTKEVPVVESAAAAEEVAEAKEVVEETLTPVVVTESVKVSGRPPVSSIPAGLTIDSIRSMSDDQIVKNWAALSELLSASK